MGLVLQAVAAHAAYYIAGGGVPNPPAQAPPGLSAPVNTILGWGKWGVMVCGVAGLLICGGKMTIGHRNRAAARPHCPHLARRHKPPPGRGSGPRRPGPAPARIFTPRDHPQDEMANWNPGDPADVPVAIILMIVPGPRSLRVPL